MQTMLSTVASKSRPRDLAAIHPPLPASPPAGTRADQEEQHGEHQDAVLACGQVLLVAPHPRLLDLVHLRRRSPPPPPPHPSSPRFPPAYARVVCTQFAVYSAGIYSATIMAQVAGDGNMITAFGWNVVVNLFYIPGSFVGCFVSDWIGPRYCLILGLAVSAYPAPLRT